MPLLVRRAEVPGAGLERRTTALQAQLVQHALLAAERVVEVLEVEPELRDAPDAIEGSGVEGLLAHAVVEAAIRSHETGQVVVVAELLDEAARAAGLSGWSR